MKASIEWLKDFTDVNVSLHDLAAALTLSGSKVETVFVTGSEINGVYVGEILEITPHENSDHLQVCKVGMGALDKEINTYGDDDNCLQIVTGARNIFVGAKVPVAIDGAHLAAGVVIKKSDLRGVSSCGMLCSVSELGYTHKDYPEAALDGIWILDEHAELGIKIQDYMGLGDEVLDFEITSNRPDCLSVEGLARETAVTLNEKFRPLPYKEIEADLEESGSNYIKVKNSAPQACLRYYGRVVKNVKIGPSPLWLRRRLSALGQNPINNIVDITNYVMLELGQPLHAFDLQDIAGGEINIRMAAAGEKMFTLDDVERCLTPDMLVIADQNKPIALAGVMGGQNSQIKDTTRDIFFEAANFEPLTVRKQAQALKMRSESSSRFDKGLDPDLARRALSRALELVQQLGIGDVLADEIAVPETEFKLPVVNFSVSALNNFLGTDIECDYIVNILEKLGCDVQRSQTAAADALGAVSSDNEVLLAVTPPNWRRDLEAMADFAEEIARFYGYDNIPATLPANDTSGYYSEKQRFAQLIKQCCMAYGAHEMLTMTFESAGTFAELGFPSDDLRLKQIEILNSSTETASLRTDFLPACLRVVANNTKHFIESGSLFEIGNCYYAEPNAEGLPLTKEKLAVVGFGNGKAAKEGRLFFDLKALLYEIAVRTGIDFKRFTFSPLKDLAMYHPYRSAAVYLDGEYIGEIAYVAKAVKKDFAVKSEVCILQIDLAPLYALATFARKQTAVNKLPAYTMDLAFEMDKQVLVGDIMDLISAQGNQYLEELKVFDIYSGDRIAAGKKSAAFTLVYRHPERTLVEADVKANIEQIISAVEAAGCKLRDAE